jgi:hypothetical protein
MELDRTNMEQITSLYNNNDNSYYFQYWGLNTGRCTWWTCALPLSYTLIPEYFHHCNKFFWVVLVWKVFYNLRSLEISRNDCISHCNQTFLLIFPALAPAFSSHTQSAISDGLTSQCLK